MSQPKSVYRRGGDRVPPALPTPATVAAQIAAQQAEPFRFAKQTRLRDVFPNTAARGPLNPSELDPLVRLVHPAVGRGEIPGSSGRFASFAISIVSGGGDTPVATSTVPNGFVVYYYTFSAFHNQVAGLDTRIDYFDPIAPQNVVVTSWLQETNTLLMPSGVAIGVKLLVCPAGLQLRAVFRGAGAGDTCTIEGIAGVLSAADPVPPGF